MQVKITVVCSYTLTRMTKTKQSENIGGEQWKPTYTAGGNIKLCNLFENVWYFLKKLKIYLPYDHYSTTTYICKRKRKYMSIKRFFDTCS